MVSFLEVLMKNIILITKVPDDCNKVVADIRCYGDEAGTFHRLDYNEDEVGDRYRAYFILQDQIRNLGID